MTKPGRKTHTEEWRKARAERIKALLANLKPAQKPVDHLLNGVVGLSPDTFRKRG